MKAPALLLTASQILQLAHMSSCGGIVAKCRDVHLPLQLVFRDQFLWRVIGKASVPRSFDGHNRRAVLLEIARDGKSDAGALVNPGAVQNAAVPCNTRYISQRARETQSECGVFEYK